MLRENTEAVVAACDAAQGRWAKLLGVRALLHPKLRLQEFLSIYNITQEFITATEKVILLFIFIPFPFLFVASSIFVFSVMIRQCVMHLNFSQHMQVGGRPGFSIRGTLQSQAKAFLDFQHESRVSSNSAYVYIISVSPGMVL